MIDWLDVVLHALGALVIVAAFDAVVDEPVLALMANTARIPRKTGGGRLAKFMTGFRSILLA